MATAKAALPNPTFFGSARSETNSIVIPANAPAGSLAFLVDLAVDSSPPQSLSTPSGWETDYSELSSSESYGLILSHRILDADDEGDTVVGMDGPDNDSKVMLVFSGPFRGASVHGVLSEITAGNPSSQSLLASGGKRPLIAMGLAHDAGVGVAAFSTVSPAWDGTVITPSDSDLIVGYKVYGLGEVPVNHTVDMNDLGAANWLATWWVSLW